MPAILKVIAAAAPVSTPQIACPCPRFVCDKTITFIVRLCIELLYIFRIVAVACPANRLHDTDADQRTAHAAPKKSIFPKEPAAKQRRPDDDPKKSTNKFFCCNLHFSASSKIKNLFDRHAEVF